MKNAMKLMLTYMHVFIADKINTYQPMVTKPSDTPCLTGHQEAYCQDLVDYPQGVIMMRLTILH